LAGAGELGENRYLCGLWPGKSESDVNVPFSITRVTRDVVESILINPAEPHRHDHEELIIITHGNPVHHIDFTQETLAPPVVLFVAHGRIHSFIPDAETRGWAIRYRSDFLPDSKFTFYTGFLDVIQFPLEVDFCSTTMNELCEIMIRETALPDVDYTMIRHLLNAVLSRLESSTSKKYLDQRSARSAQVITFNNFLRILEYNFKRPVGVEFYADKLNMLARNLNLISQAVFGKSVTEVIETRRMIEAKQMILNTHKSISEIGFELGYNEKSYFTRVFRKRTGVTPTGLRQQVHGVIS